MKQICSWALACALLISLPGTAGAEGFSIIDWSARGLGLAGGMVARADDASAVAYNPAGITQLPGMQLMLGTTVVSPVGKMDTIDGGVTTTTSIERKHWVMPHLYVTTPLNDRLWLGVGVFSRFGLGNGYPKDWPRSASFTDVKLETITLNPNLAWKATDKLSLAVGVEITGAMMEMNKYVYMGGLGNNHVKLTGAGMALSGNVALHYAFNDAWSLGLTYRSRMNLNVHGKTRWDRQLGAVNPLMRNSDLHGTINLPDSIAAAIAWKPTSKLSFEAGVVYTAWGNYRNLDISLENPVNDVMWSPKHWRDTWTFNVSAEYQALDWLALRAGYGYDTSPANMANADYMVPTNGRMYFNAGVGVSWKQWTMDLGYSYLLMRDLNMNEAAAKALANNPFQPDILPGKMHSAYANIVSLSLTYKF